MEETIKLQDVKGEETTALLQEDNTISTLIQVKQVPSGFKGYPKGTIIYYEPLTLEELTALNTDKNITPTRAVAMLLKSIKCNTLPVEDLYYWDVMYIGIERKLQAFGDVEGERLEYCPNCKNLVRKRFRYSDIEFKEVKVPDLPIKIEVSGKLLECKPITIKQFLQYDITLGELGIFAYEIQNMPFEDAYELVKRATGIDIKKIKFIDRQLDYGMKPFIVKCDNKIEIPNPNFDNNKPESAMNKKKVKKVCNEEVVMEVRSPFEVVFPEDSIDRDIDFEVQYG